MEAGSLVIVGEFLPDFSAEANDEDLAVDVFVSRARGPCAPVVPQCLPANRAVLVRINAPQHTDLLPLL